MHTDRVSYNAIPNNYYRTWVRFNGAPPTQPELEVRAKFAFKLGLSNVSTATMLQIDDEIVKGYYRLFTKQRELRYTAEEIRQAILQLDFPRFRPISLKWSKDVQAIIICCRTLNLTCTQASILSGLSRPTATACMTDLISTPYKDEDGTFTTFKETALKRRKVLFFNLMKILVAPSLDLEDENKEDVTLVSNGHN